MRNDDTTINGQDHFIHRSFFARGGNNAKRDGKGQCQSARQASDFDGKNVIFAGTGDAAFPAYLIYSVLISPN